MLDICGTIGLGRFVVLSSALPPFPSPNSSPPPSFLSIFLLSYISPLCLLFFPKFLPISPLLFLYISPRFPLLFLSFSPSLLYFSFISLSHFIFHFCWPYSLKGILKPKIEKKWLCYPFFTVFVQIFAGKKSQILYQVACGDHIVLISQTDDICFSLYIKDYW